MSRKRSLFIRQPAPAAILLLLAFFPAASGYVYDTTAAGARWTGPTLNVQMRMGPSKFTVTGATVTLVIEKTPFGYTSKTTVTCPGGAFDTHGPVGMLVTGPGIPAGTRVRSIGDGVTRGTDATTVVLDQNATVNGSNLTVTFSKILSDGSSSWNATAENAFALWNEQMRDLQVTWTELPPDARAVADNKGAGATSVQWSTSEYGTSFDAYTLAVTFVHYSGARMTECDVVLNAKFSYDSYSEGGITAYGRDAHRVAMHEFGHVLGLDHPDQNHSSVGYTAPSNPPPAIMTSIAGALYRLQSDDIAGIHSLYGTNANAPSAETGNARLANISTRAHVGTGERVMIAGFVLQGSAPKKLIIRAIGPSTGVPGALANPKLELLDKNGAILRSNDDWQLQPTLAERQAVIDSKIVPGNSFEAAIVATLPANGTSYTVKVSGSDGGSGIALAEVYDLDAPSLSASKLINVSTRADVGTGDNVLIGGIIIGGPQVKQVVVRAIGPSLTNYGISAPLANPTLELRNANGDLLTFNNDYGSPHAGPIATYGLEPLNPVESGLAVYLAPGAYTAIVRGVNNGVGIALVEAYGVL